MGMTWTLLAAITGFLSAFLLSDLLGLTRGPFVAGHTVVVAVFVSAFVRAHGFSLRRQLERRWVAGLLGGLVFSALLIRQVVSQPSSPAPEGLALVGALAGYGIVYGVVDALLLSVIPVLSLYGMRSAEELKLPGARLNWGAIALAGSAVVSAAYHLGFAEFRSAAVLSAVLGNTLITLGYLLTGSPLTPIVAHVLMHVAAVVHGIDTVIQLPPH